MEAVRFHGATPFGGQPYVFRDRPSGVRSILSFSPQRLLLIDGLLQLFRSFHELYDRLACFRGRLDGYAAVAEQSSRNGLLNYDVVDLVERVFLGLMGEYSLFVNEARVCDGPDVDPSIEIAVKEQDPGNGRRIGEQVIQQHFEPEDSYVADGQVEKDRRKKERGLHENKPVFPYDQGNGFAGLEFGAHVCLLQRTLIRYYLAVSQKEVIAGPFVMNRVTDRGIVKPGVLMGLVDFAYTSGISAKTARRREQKALSQFMTPPSVARFMAQRCLPPEDLDAVRILDPSAGAGILTAAVVECLLDRPIPPGEIRVVLYEIDERFVQVLRNLVGRMRRAAASRRVLLTASVRTGDFLLSPVGPPRVGPSRTLS